MNRREFLKRTFQAAGLAGLYSLGAGAIEEAIARGIMPAIATLGGTGSGDATNTNFLTWDKTTETGWGDTANVFICVAQNTSAGGNETGEGGGLSGLNLVLTQSGNIAGMSGGARAFDGGDDYMQVTTAHINNFLAKDNPVFCLIHEFDTWSQTEPDQGITRFVVEAAADNCLSVIANNRYVRADFADGAVDNFTDYTVDAMPVTGTVLVYAESDGSNIKCGWDTVRRGSWDDIPTNRKSIKTKAITWAGLSFTEQTFMLSATVTTNMPAFNWHYTVFASKTLAQIGA